MTTRLLFVLSFAFSACGGSADSVPEASAAQSLNAVQRDLLKACRAEVPGNVKAIKDTESSYDAEMDQFLSVSAYPTGPLPGPEGQSWGSGNKGFNALGWKADGTIRGVYSVSTTRPSSQTPGGDFRVVGRIDCDGDGVEATYTATKSLNTRLTTEPDIF
jgi:hypothetical protein